VGRTDKCSTAETASLRLPIRSPGHCRMQPAQSRPPDHPTGRHV
jgi:hypothetical protein